MHENGAVVIELSIDSCSSKVPPVLGLMKSLSMVSYRVLNFNKMCP